MMLVSLLLFFLPLIGPFIAGFVGGRRAGSLANAILAALLPSLVLASALLMLSSAISGIPVIGTIATLGSLAIAFSGVGPLLLGAIISGAITPSRTTKTSKPALILVGIFCALAFAHVVSQVNGTIGSAGRMTRSKGIRELFGATSRNRPESFSIDQQQIWESLVDSLNRRDELKFRRLVSTKRFEYNEYGTRSDVGQVATEEREIAALAGRVFESLIARAEFVDCVPRSPDGNPGTDAEEFVLSGSTSGTAQVRYTFQREGSGWRLVHVWGG